MAKVTIELSDGTKRSWDLGSEPELEVEQTRAINGRPTRGYGQLEKSNSAVVKIRFVAHDKDQS